MKRVLVVNYLPTGWVGDESNPPGWVKAPRQLSELEIMVRGCNPPPKVQKQQVLNDQKLSALASMIKINSYETS